MRIYWDGLEYPSVECPVGDFFACGWGEYAQVSSLAVCVNLAVPLTATGRCPLRSMPRLPWKTVMMNL